MRSLGKIRRLKILYGKAEKGDRILLKEQMAEVNCNNFWLSKDKLGINRRGMHYER